MPFKEFLILLSSNSIIQKAAAALDVLREVLDAVDTKHPEVCWGIKYYEC